MGYQIKITDAGGVREKIFYHSHKYPEKGTTRRKRSNPTSDAVKKVNEAHAVDKLFFKLCANFTDEDLYITLKYDGEINRAVAPEQMKKDMRRFLDLLRYQYKKSGKELKFVYCYGVSSNKVRHFHAVLTGFDQKVIQRCWEKATSHAGRINFEYLWSGYNYRGLAEYFIKNGKEAKAFDSEAFTQLYSCSRNLIKPKVKVKKVTRSGTFRERTLADEGFEVVSSSVRGGYDIYGHRYFKFLMVKKE